ncbi:ABC transporter permease [Leptolyngbya ohadii]|uniref:ABC transporter permease n=1 Tax=Leptolyngbya ohadii TaxID=1962290 RepID=UPI000B59BB48|nr:ABC transporter permease [Leptolyngbya ohadii]
MTKLPSSVESLHWMRQAPDQGRSLPRERLWSKRTIVLWQLGITVGLLTLWEAGTRIGWIDAFFWSSPLTILKTGIVFFRQGSAIRDIGFTFRSTIVGFFLGTGLGTAIGLTFWWSRNYAAIAQPLIIAFHATPKLALGPLVILVFGMGFASKVAMAVALTIVISVLTTYSGVQAVDRDLQQLMYSMGATRWQVFTKVVIPSALPWIISSLRVNIGLSLSGAIVGEFLGSQAGLGRLILYAGQTYDIALVWVGVLVLAALSVVMYVLVQRLERVLLKGVMHETQSVGE